MRLRNKTVIGRIDEQGKISAPWKPLEEFLSLHKGKAVMIRYSIMPEEASEKTENYFFGYVVQEIRNAFMVEYGEHLTKGETYDRIRKECPLFYKEERVDGKWKVRLREFEELDQAEVNEVIEWCFQYAAENLSCVLQNPI